MANTEIARAVLRGKRIWKKHREDYMEKRKFGEEELNRRIYNDYLIDYEGRTWEENRAIVNAQIMAIKYKRSTGPLWYSLPSGLSDNAIQVCEAVLTREHIHPTSKLIRHSNGRAMSTAAIGSLAGITGTRTMQRTLKELVDRGVFIKEKRGIYKASENIFKKIS